MLLLRFINLITLLESSGLISQQCLVGGIETSAITEAFGEFR